MADFQTILAVVQEDVDAPNLLSKLQRVAANQTCDISMIRVVYDGLADLKSKHIAVSKELKERVLSTAQTTLRDTIEKTGIEVPGLTSAAMWNSRTSAGIIHAASSVGADLIIKTSDNGSSIPKALRTPDDWNLLRQAEVPVLLTQPGAWSPQPAIVAAVDVYDPGHDDLNARILASAQQLTHQLNGELHLVSIFPSLNNWQDEFTSIQSYTQLRRDVEQETLEELAAFSRQEKVNIYKAHAVEGSAADGMRNLIGLLGADLMVLGTKARTGVTGILLGNTAEKLLHEVACDVLTVP
jgi:universal stress protein E